MIHATAVAWEGWAVLLTGASGAGKSDLALRLIDRGWALVSDDNVRLEANRGGLVARGFSATAGLIELRGLGLFPAARTVAAARVALVVDLGPEPERLPEPAVRTLLGIAVPLVRLDPRPPSAPIRLAHAFARARAALEAGPQ